MKQDGAEKNGESSDRAGFQDVGRFVQPTGQASRSVNSDHRKDQVPDQQKPGEDHEVRDLHSHREQFFKGKSAALLRDRDGRDPERQKHEPQIKNLQGVE